MTTKRDNQKSLAVGSLRFQPSESSILGQTISYLQKQPGTNARDAVVRLLFSRYLPFIFDKTEPNYIAVALDCATECERWGRLIREYAGLPLTGDNSVHHNHSAVVRDEHS